MPPHDTTTGTPAQHTTRQNDRDTTPADRADALVMFGLAFAKRRIATRIDSTPLEAEASMTFLDGILSTATMLGLLLNATLGWWWADPAAAFLVGLAAASEARENWNEASELQRGQPTDVRRET